MVGRSISGTRKMNSRLSFGQVKQVQKIVNKNKRLKTAWYNINSSATSGTPIFTDITAISEGEDFSQRDSDHILAASLRVQWSMINANTATNQIVRVMIVRGLHGNLLSSDMPAVGVTPNLDLMQVLYDETIHLPGAVFDPITRFHFKSFKNKKVPHMRVTYNDAASATNAFSNPVYYYAVSSVGTNGAQISGYAKLKFFDAN